MGVICGPFGDQPGSGKSKSRNEVLEPKLQLYELETDAEVDVLTSGTDFEVFRAGFSFFPVRGLALESFS